MLGCSFQAFSSSEPVLKFRSFSEFLLTSHFQVLVSTAKPCDSTDERLILHHVPPPPPLPLHLHLRPAGDAGAQHNHPQHHLIDDQHFPQFFGGQLNFPEGTPTSNFDSIINALLTVFQVPAKNFWEILFTGSASER